MTKSGHTQEQEYVDDPSILNDEYLLRGLLKEHLPNGVVSSAAFKPSKRTGPRSHLSVWREVYCDPQKVLAKELPRSVAFARLTAEAPRALQTEVVGVGLVDGVVLAHARIIRNPDVDPLSETWLIVAVLLAEACTVAHYRRW